MFEEIFRQELDLITQDKNLVEKLWQEIVLAYTSKGRHYHHLTHLDHLLVELVPCRPMIDNWLAIVLSVAYHDFVYDPLRNDNEAQSAIVAKRCLARLSLDATLIATVVVQIQATKSHTLSPDNDTNYLMDADLSIFGADEDVYNDYAKSIRKEYRLVPNFLFNQGRRKMLMHFLEMETIFKTDHFRSRYEVQAKINLQRELLSLQAH